MQQSSRSSCVKSMSRWIAVWVRGITTTSTSVTAPCANTVSHSRSSDAGEVRSLNPTSSRSGRSTCTSPPSSV